MGGIIINWYSFLTIYEALGKKKGALGTSIIEINKIITGVEMLMKLYEFKIDRDKPYLVEIDRGDAKIAITEDNKVYFSQLFEGIV